MSAVAAVRPPVEEPPPEAGPRFRDDVELLALESWQGGPTRWYARQPESRELFELGREAAFLCRHLDGRTSPAELHRRLEEEFGTPAEEDDVEIFLEQLARSGLLAGSVPQRGPATLPELFDP
ncbi:MAG TPA: PqqD family protein, partial [Thermoanaerobaculia bacterium]